MPLIEELQRQFQLRRRFDDELRQLLRPNRGPTFMVREFFAEDSPRAAANLPFPFFCRGGAVFAEDRLGDQIGRRFRSHDHEGEPRLAAGAFSRLPTWQEPGWNHS